MYFDYLIIRTSSSSFLHCSESVIQKNYDFFFLYRIIFYRLFDPEYVHFVSISCFTRFHVRLKCLKKFVYGKNNKNVST